MNREPSGFDPAIPSVSNLTEKIRNLLEPNFTDVLVEGELSNIYRSRNGHIYFTVKDSRAQLPCVVWSRTAERLKYNLTDGQQVILGGSVQIYPPQGKYQLIVSSVQQAGIGRLQQAFEHLKEKLRREGLFDPEKKVPLPTYPLRIGVITSAAGAAFHDIISTLEKRWPLATVLLYHASVQGALATAELVAGIRHFSREPSLDVLIIGRGGGSLEDLWPFNEEAVARALFDCPVPVISAVGHETDFSISDFVADVRAATPTQAALLATPDRNEVRLLLDDRTERVARILRDRVIRYRQETERLGQSHALLVTRRKLDERDAFLQHLRNRMDVRLARQLPGKKERIEILKNQLTNRLDRLTTGKREKLQHMLHKIEINSPNKPLEKGFVRVWQDGRWVRDPDILQTAKTLELEWQKKRTPIGPPEAD